MLGCAAFAAPVFADDDGDSARPFPADRPGKANGPFTVDQGQFDIESDFINVVHDHWASSPVTSNGITAADPLLKMGITHDMDMELQVGGYQSYSFKDRTTGTKTNAYCWADNVLRLKYNLAGNDGSAFGIAVLPYVKIPTAPAKLRSVGLANNHVEGGLMLPMNYNLPNDFSLGFQTEIDANKNANNGNYHTSFANIPSIAHPVPGIDNLSAMLEFYSNVNTSKSPDDPSVCTLDVAFIYQATPKLAFDVEVDNGLNRAAADTEIISGVAWVF